MTCTRYTRDMAGRSQNGDVFVLETEYMKLRAENARLSALADRWNTECDAMREDNKRLAAELATAREWNERYAIELRELREQKPVASLFRSQSNIIECFYRGSLCPIDGNNFHNDFVVALPLGRSVPLYARPVPAAQAECTHDCNQGRDCTCRKGGQ